MKKNLIAIAALALAGGASAQSSITIFGVMDATIGSYSNKTNDASGSAIKTSKTTLGHSGYTTSRLGFRGTEDLGGGLAASFWLEAGLLNDQGLGAGTDGSLNFQRRSTVSLSSASGELRIGREYVPSFWNETVFDPFNGNGVGTSLLYSASNYASQGAQALGFVAHANQIRASNSISYFLPPNLGGIYGQVMYAFNERIRYDPGSLAALAAAGNNARAGRYVGGRVGYANGPLDVAVAYAESTIASNYVTGTTTTLDILNMGASYDFGVVKLMGLYSKNKLKIDQSSGLANPLQFSEPGMDGWVVGATMPIGPGLVRVSYAALKYTDTRRVNPATGLLAKPKSEKFAIGYVHNLSKRTALYTTVARVSNKDGADMGVIGSNYFTATARTGPLTPNTSIGYEFGVRHAF